MVALQAALLQQMPNLDVDQCALVLGVGRMLALVRAANPRAGGILAVFIEKSAFDNKDFLATEVRVCIELRVRRPFDECDLLGFILMQAHDLEARDKAR